MGAKVIKSIWLFLLLVIIDFLLIQGMRHITPKIVLLRLSIILVVFTLSIFAYFILLKPQRIMRTGIILSLVAFATALGESYIIHVVVERSVYQPMYFLPSVFALLLPTLVAFIYRSIIAKKQTATPA